MKIKHGNNLNILKMKISRSTVLYMYLGPHSSSLLRLAPMIPVHLPSNVLLGERERAPHL